MGHRLISQNRGRGTPTYRAPSHKFKAALRHPRVDEKETLYGTVTEIVHDPARSAPVAKVMFENGNELLILASEGMAVEDKIACGTSARAYAKRCRSTTSAILAAMLRTASSGTPSGVADWSRRSIGLLT